MNATDARALEGEPSVGAQAGANRRARLDDRHAHADRHFPRPLARPDLQFRPVLDRAPVVAGPRPRLLVGVEMGAKGMSSASLYPPFDWIALLRLATFAVAGDFGGALYFASVWRSATRLAAGARLTKLPAPALSASSCWGCCWSCRRRGAAPLLPTAAGVLFGRAFVLRRRKRGCAMNSPLATPTCSASALFRSARRSSRPGGSWPRWSSGAFLASRSLTPRAGFRAGLFRAPGRKRRQPDPRYDARRACALSRLYRRRCSCSFSPPTGPRLIPGVEPPTAHLETDAALAFLVFWR